MPTRTEPTNQWPFTIEWHTNVEPSRWYICRFGDSCRTSSADEANVGAEDSHCRSSGDGSDIGLAGDHQWLTDSKSNPTQHLCPLAKEDTLALSAHHHIHHRTTYQRRCSLSTLTNRPTPSVSRAQWDQCSLCVVCQRQWQTVGPADKCWQMVVVVPTGPVSLLIIFFLLLTLNQCPNGVSFGLWSHLNQVHTPYTFSPSTFAILPIRADVVGQKEVVSPLFNWFIDHLLLVCRAPILVAESVDRGGRLCGFGYSRGRSASLLLRRPFLVTSPDGMRGLGLGRRGVVCML